MSLIIELEECGYLGAQRLEKLLEDNGYELVNLCFDGTRHWLRYKETEMTCKHNYDPPDADWLCPHCHRETEQAWATPRLSWWRRVLAWFGWFG